MSEETAAEEPAARDGDETVPDDGDGTPPAGEAEPAGDGAGLDDGDGDGPQPLGVGVEPTGHGAVDAGLRRLEDADHLAVSGHTEVYEDVHRGLRDTLAALDRPSPRS